MVSTNGISVGILVQADGMNKLDSNMKAGNKEAQFDDNSYWSSGQDENVTHG